MIIASCKNQGCELERVGYEIEDTSLPTYCGSCGVRMSVPGETAPPETAPTIADFAVNTDAMQTSSQSNGN